MKSLNILVLALLLMAPMAHAESAKISVGEKRLAQFSQNRQKACGLINKLVSEGKIAFTESGGGAFRILCLGKKMSFAVRQAMVTRIMNGITDIFAHNSVDLGTAGNLADISNALVDVGDALIIAGAGAPEGPTIDHIFQLNFKEQ